MSALEVAVFLLAALGIWCVAALLIAGVWALIRRRTRGHVYDDDPDVPTAAQREEWRRGDR